MTGNRKGCYWLIGLLMASTVLPESSALPIVERGGKAHVSAARLEREAGIAIKSLPGRDELVACWVNRCAIIKDFVADDAEVLVAVESLATSLDAKARFDQTRRNVRFDFSPAHEDARPPASGVARVGQLAPDFRLRKLDGSSVALSDFRGKRVLINSWASW